MLHRRRFASLVLAATVLLAPALPAAAQSATHTVQEGETLWQIAFDAGMDTSTLMAINGLENGDVIYVGQVLKLSGSPAAVPSTPAPAPAPAAVTHTVAEGDTLSGIARQYGVTTDAIMGANGIEDPNVVVVGAQLKVPGGSQASVPVVPTTAPPAPAATPAPAAPAPVATAAAASTGRTLSAPYVVQPGETLHGIARQFNTTADAIARESGLNDPNLIGVGTVLRVPLPSREHVIQKGETLYAIAAQEKVDLGVLISFNNITDPGMIRVGDVLLIPSGGDAPLPQVPVTPTPVVTLVPPTATPVPPTAAPGGPSVTPAAPAATATPKPPASPTATPTRRAVQVPEGTPRDGLVGEVVKLLGLPYVFGGSGPSSFDCSGLVWYAAKQLGKPLPRGLFDQYDAGQHPAKDQLKPGDIVFFQNTYMPGLSHNGIFIGNGQFIHAADESSGVTISSMGSPYWATRFFGATRLP